MERKRIVVLGIGNSLLGDEGIGIHVARELAARELPEGVEVVDGGTAGVALVDYVCEADRLIVVDAILRDAPGGTIFRLAPEEIGRDAPFASSPHGIGLLDLLDLAASSGSRPESVVFGVVPSHVGWGEELSPELAVAAAEVVRLVLGELEALC